VIVTTVPPADGPELGVREVTTGRLGGAAYVKRSVALVAEVPPGAITVTSTMPLPAGLTALIEVGERIWKLAADAVPNVTAVVPAKPVPVIVTAVPPAAGPPVGVNDVTTGSGGGGAT
jgi:hypothetical protein